MYGNNISDKKKYLLAYKERLLRDINFYDKEIADFRDNKVISKEEYYDGSDSEDEAVYKPIKVTQSLNDVVKIKERLDHCLVATQELSNLTVLESGITVLNEEPKLKQYPSKPGIWKEVLAECRVDSVPISIRFSVLQPYRRFAQSTFHELQVLPVKEFQEKELKDSVLHTSKTPCEAVEVIRNYAAASRSRKTTLAKLAEYFADSISMEPADEGGIVMKCGEAIEIFWTLENRVSTVAPFQNKFKLAVNEINPSYIGELKEAYKRLRYPDLDTDERTLALATIIKMCLDSVPENKSEDEMLVDEVIDDNTSKGNKENMSPENQNDKKGTGKNKNLKNNQNILKENTNIINKEGKKQISGTNKNPKDKTTNNNNKIQNDNAKKSKENVNLKENVDTVKDKLDEVPTVNNIHNIKYNCIENPSNNKEVLKNKNKQSVNNEKNTKVKSKQMQNNENCANNAMTNIDSNDEVFNYDENVEQTNAKKCTNEKSSKENEVKNKQKSRNTNKNTKDVGITDKSTKEGQNDENVISNENNVTKDTKDSEKRNKNEKNTENCNVNPIDSEKILKKDKKQSNQKTKEITKTKSNKKVETAKDVAIENAKEINVLNKQNILKRKTDAANEHEVKKLKSSKNQEQTAADKVISKSHKEIVSKETVVDVNSVERKDLDKNNTDACKNKKINEMAHEREKNNHIEAKENNLEVNNKSKAVNTKPNIKSVTSTSKGNVKNGNTEHGIVKSKVEIKTNKTTNKPVNIGNTGDNKKINTINRENLKSGNTINQLSDKTNVKSLNCKETNKKSAIKANKIVNNKIFNNNRGTKNIHQNIINKNFTSKFKPRTGTIQNGGTSKIPQKMSPSIQRKMINMIRRSPRISTSVVRKRENHHSSIPRIIKPVQAK